MLLNLYNELFIMSIVSGLLYLILKIVSPITMKYFKASWHYYTYLTVYLFLFLPYHKIISLLNFKPRIQTVLSLPSLTSNANLPLLVRHDLVETACKIEIDISFLPYIFIIGTLVFIMVILVQNFKIHYRIFSVCRLSDDPQLKDILRECKQEMGISNNVPLYISSCVNTPFIYGVMKPRIVLSDVQFTAEESRYVIQHELTHWKRHDGFLKYMMLLINVLHWFNPLAYLIRREIDCFSELSCDESVVKSMNSEERRQYCELILGMFWNITGRNIKLFSAFSDKQKQLERRMNLIMKSEGLKGKNWLRMTALVITITLTVGGAITAHAATVNTVFPKVEETFEEKQPNAFFSSDFSVASELTNDATEISTDVTIEGTKISDYKPMATGDLGSGKSYSYDKQYLSKGQKITINAEWSPTGSNIKIGLKSSSDTVTAKTVSGGSGSVTYSINKSGDYYIYIGNPSKSSVKFDVSYIVN